MHCALNDYISTQHIYGPSNFHTCIGLLKMTKQSDHRFDFFFSFQSFRNFKYVTCTLTTVFTVVKCLLIKAVVFTDKSRVKKKSTTNVGQNRDPYLDQGNNISWVLGFICRLQPRCSGFEATQPAFCGEGSEQFEVLNDTCTLFFIGFALNFEKQVRHQIC